MTESITQSECVPSPVYISSLSLFVACEIPIAKSAAFYTTFNWSRKIVTIPSVEITREEAIQGAVGRFRELGCTFLRDSETAPYSNVFQSHTIKRKHPNFIFYDAKSAIRSFKFNSPSCIKVICITRLLYFCSVFWRRQRRTNSDVYHTRNATRG